MHEFKQHDQTQMILRDLAASVRFGEPVTYSTVTVVPVMSPSYLEPEYVSVDRAMKEGNLVIEEISHSGSVPQLRAVNKGKYKILLPEGEELKGAKQNRTLNTSILMAEESELIIPVSCTEQGRWRYRTRRFETTDSWLPAGLRMKKNRDVTLNLMADNEYRSNQRLIWDEVDHILGNVHRFHSSTKAIRDLMDTRKEKLEEWSSHFPLREGQTGVAVFLNGKLTGMDIITYAPYFREVYSKVLKSYLFEFENMRKRPSKWFEIEKDQIKADAQAYLDVLEKLKRKWIDTPHYEAPSPGLGKQIRWMQEGFVGGMTGFVLHYLDKPVHVQVFI